MNDDRHDLRLSPVQAVRLVAGRELRTRVTSKATLVLTVLLVVAVLAMILLLKLLGGGISSSKVGLMPGTADLAAPLKSSASAVSQHVKTVTVTDRKAGEKQVTDGKLDALVVGSADSYRVEVKKDLKEGLKNTFHVMARQQALNAQLVKAGADPAAVNRAVAGAQVTVHPLEPVGSHRGERIWIGSVAGILVYISLMIFGQSVTQGVVEEKSSRIVELLLSAIRPWQLMLGKVLGIGVVGLAQIVIVVGIGAGTAIATGTLDLPTSVAVGAAIWALVWYLLGFVIYALLFAAAGSLVSRQEDAAGVVTPISMLILVPYILGISILPASPDNGVLHVLSLIPLFSPTLMPFRVALGVPAWETWTALGLGLLLIVALVWLAGRVYNNAVLRTGTRVKLSDALRSAS